MPVTDSLPLNDGNHIPRLGLGFYQLTPSEAEQVALTGMDAGYKLLDTAQGYGNEDGIGRALDQRHGEAVFVTSKLRNAAHARDDALRAFDATMKKLRLEQLDLFLIHWPRPGQNRFVEAWRTLIELRDEGRIRLIGVSNFTADHLERLIDETGVVPVVNQIELHPRFQQKALRAVHQGLGIVTESWSPLGQGRLLDDPAITAIAKRHGRTAAQVIIRWHIEQDLVVIPKSANPSRIRDNSAVFDFALDEDDLTALAALDDTAGRIGPDPETAEFSF